MIPKFVDNMELRLKNFDNCFIMRDTLETSDVSGGGAELFLYQSGYLTIKCGDEFGYTLGFPNEEVKQALYNTVLPALTTRQILNSGYLEPFKADKRQVVGLGIELDENGKGLLDWQVVD